MPVYPGALKWRCYNSLEPDTRLVSFKGEQLLHTLTRISVQPFGIPAKGNLRLSGRSSVRQCTIQTLSENSRKALPSWVVLCDLEADKLSTVHHLASRQVNSSLQEFSSFLFALE